MFIPHRRDWKCQGVGHLKAKNLEKCWKLDWIFRWLGGGGGGGGRGNKRKIIPFAWGGMDINWNHTL